MVALPVSGLRPLWPLHGHGLPGLVGVKFQTKVRYVLNCQPVHGLRAARDGGHVDRHPVAIGHQYVCHLSEGSLRFLFVVVTTSQLFHFNNFLRSNVYFRITFLLILTMRGECLVAPWTTSSFRNVKHVVLGAVCYQVIINHHGGLFFVTHPFNAVTLDDRLRCEALRMGRGAPAERILAPEASGGLRLPPQPLLRRPGSAGQYRHQRRRQSLKVWSS